MTRLKGSHNGVPWRNHEIIRVEALSDAVFAFAVTLLVIALEVPHTFAELWAEMHGFFAFAISFDLLFQVWYTQHIFFRRYGLQDGLTVLLNGLLLFVVLFYMYPLKFLFTLLMNEMFWGGGVSHVGDGTSVPMIADASEAAKVMIIYGIGFSAIYTVFVLLYIHVFRKRKVLKLTEEEIFDCRSSLVENGLMVFVALLSMLIVWVTGSAAMASLSYVLILILQTVCGLTNRRKRRRLFGA